MSVSTVADGSNESEQRPGDVTLPVTPGGYAPILANTRSALAGPFQVGGAW